MSTAAPRNAEPRMIRVPCTTTDSVKALETHVIYRCIEHHSPGEHTTTQINVQEWLSSLTCSIAAKMCFSMEECLAVKTIAKIAKIKICVTLLHLSLNSPGQMYSMWI